MLCMVFFIASCQKKEEKTKKMLKLNFLSGDVLSLDPHNLILNGRGIALGKWLFEGLTRIQPNGEVALAGAEKVDISPCQTRYLFTLRPNYYSDGTPILAHDYEIAWKKALSPDSKCGRTHLFYPIKNAEKAKKGEISLEHVGIQALDDKTLLVELNRPTPYFLNLLSFPLFVPFKEKEGEVFGSGPYMVAQWQKDACLTLKLNPFFWDHDHMHIKNVKISMIKDEMTAFYLYEKGEIDWIGDPFSPLPSDTLASEIAKGSLSKQPIIRPLWIYLNTEVFPLSSPLIRHALSSVINRRLIAEHIFIGTDALFTPLPKCFSSEASDPNDDDLAKGQKLFQEGLKELGLTKETFPPITLSCCHLNKHKKLGEYLREKWRTAFGIKVHLKIQEWNTFYSDLQRGNYQIGGCLTSSEYEDPLALLERLAYANNFSQWNHLHYRTLINQIKEEGNLELRSQFIQQAETILKEEMPMIWMTNQSLHYSHCPDLKGVCFDHTGVPDLRWAYFEEK